MYVIQVNQGAKKYWLMVSLWLAISGAVWAHSYRTVGVDSNFVVHEGRVYFAQRNGFVVALDLESGEVQAATKLEWGEKQLSFTESGLRVTGYELSRVLDLNTLAMSPGRLSNRGGFDAEVFSDAAASATAITLNDGQGRYRKEFATGLGMLQVTTQDRGPTRFPLYLEFCGDDGNSMWSGKTEDSGGRFEIELVGAGEWCILLASSRGSVECLDAATGQSKWTYLFPAIHRRGVSSRSLVPGYASECVARFSPEGLARDPIYALTLEGETPAPPPKLILEARTQKRMAQYPWMRVVVWLALGFVLVGPSLISKHAKKKAWPNGAVFAVMALPALVALVLFNTAMWLSWLTSVAIGFGLLLSLTTALAMPGIVFTEQGRPGGQR